MYCMPNERNLLSADNLVLLLVYEQNNSLSINKNTKLHSLLKTTLLNVC